jgi:hypothetical protein
MGQFKTYLTIVILAFTIVFINAGDVLCQTDVKVVNSSNEPVPVRDLEEALREPFLKKISIPIAGGQTSNSASIAVPAGKRLVIESVSGGTFLLKGQALYVLLSTDVTGDLAFDGTLYLLGNNIQFNTNQDLSGFTQQVRLYSTSIVAITACRAGGAATNFSGDINVQVTVSGYLLDKP